MRPASEIFILMGRKKNIGMAMKGDTTASYSLSNW